MEIEQPEIVSIGAAAASQVTASLTAALRGLPSLSTIPAKKRHTLINTTSGEMTEGKYCATEADLEAIRALSAAAVRALSLLSEAVAQ